MSQFTYGVLKALDVWSLFNAVYPFGVICLLWLAVWASIRVVRLINDTFR